MVENPNGRMIRANDPILIMLMKDKKDTAIQKSEIDYSIREMNDKLYSIKLEKDLIKNSNIKGKAYSSDFFIDRQEKIKLLIGRLHRISTARKYKIQEEILLRKKSGDLNKKIKERNIEITEECLKIVEIAKQKLEVQA